MDNNFILIAGSLEKTTEARVRQLVNRTLAPLEPVIDIIVVNVGHDNTLPLDTFDFHCTILLKIKGGTIIRAEAREGDDILAVYRALAKIVDQTLLKDAQ